MKTLPMAPFGFAPLLHQAQQSRIPRPGLNDWCEPTELGDTQRRMGGMLNEGGPPGVGGIYSPRSDQALRGLQERLNDYDRFRGRDIGSDFMDQAQKLLGRPALDLEEAARAIWEHAPTDGNGMAIEYLQRQYGIKTPWQGQPGPWDSDLPPVNRNYQGF